MQGLWDQVPKPLRARLCSTRNDLCYDQVRASLLSSTWPAGVNIMRMELSKTLCRTEDIFWIHGSFTSTILADSLNCMECWVKVSVRRCTNRDNIQFQLHQTMSVTRPERYQIGTINCGAPSQADFILNYSLNFPLKIPQFSSKFLKFPQISSQILHTLLAWLAG